MVNVSTSHDESFEEWSPTLFLVAGGLLVVYAVLNGLEAFANAAYPTVQDVFGPAGFAFGFVGLLGLYPRLVDRAPALARTGAIAAVLGTVGFSVISVRSLAHLAGITSGAPPAWLAIFVLLAAIGMIPGFLSFAAASLRTDGRSRTVGLLLLAPPVVFAAMLVGAGVGFTTAWSAFVISAGQALAHLAIGYSLRTGLVSTDREVPSGDVTAS